MIHLCSVKSTHTKNTICRCLPAGKKEQAPPPCFLLLVTHSFSLTSSSSPAAQVARAPLLPGGKNATAPVWCWVTFGKQSRVISRECRRRQVQATRDLF